MIPTQLLTELSGVIGDVDAASIESVGGGSINQCYSFRGTDGTRYFLKTNRAANTHQARDMFAAEQAGLTELAEVHCVRVPRPIALSDAGGFAWLLMEYLSLGHSDERAEGRMGTLLARQHRHCAASFGWSRDNTIGTTEQRNKQCDDWIAFFGKQRLGFQLRLVTANEWATIESALQELINALPAFFTNYGPEPSLLHGDLWGGNWGATVDGEPVCFDPAVYYGDRETDLAMTKLFGGFGPAFYTAYNNEWPLDPGFGQRCDLYNLYHVLNHLNLFGHGYLNQADTLLNRLLSQI